MKMYTVDYLFPDTLQKLVEATVLIPAVAQLLAICHVIIPMCTNTVTCRLHERQGERQTVKE